MTDQEAKSQMADMATQEAAQASTRATTACSKEAHDLAAKAHQKAFESQALAYGAAVKAGADENLIDTHRNQMVEHERMAQMHRKEAAELALKENGMEGADAKALAKQARLAACWSALANVTRKESDHRYAMECHAAVAEAAKKFGDEFRATRHASASNFHALEAANAFAAPLQAGGVPPGCHETDFKFLWLNCNGGGSLHA